MSFWSRISHSHTCDKVRHGAAENESSRNENDKPEVLSGLILGEEERMHGVVGDAGIRDGMLGTERAIAGAREDDIEGDKSSNEEGNEQGSSKADEERALQPWPDLLLLAKLPVLVFGHEDLPQRMR